MSSISSRIVYEDNHLIAINKECGEIVQGDKTGDKPLVEELRSLIKKRDNKPGNVFAEAVHRIDRPVSGVMIFAKTSKALSRMNKLFHDGEVKKFYWAVVSKLPPKESDTLTHHIKKNKEQNKSYVYSRSRSGTREASLTYHLAGTTARYYFLEVELHTGRHHQIRAQLSSIGCNIRGDLKYGYPRSNPNGGINLHSRKIKFTHPISNQPITIEAPPPKDVLWDEILGISKKI